MKSLSTACVEAQSLAIDRFRSVVADGATIQDYKSDVGTTGIEIVASGGNIRDMTYFAADVVGWEPHSGDLPDDALQRLLIVLNARNEVHISETGSFER